MRGIAVGLLLGAAALLAPAARAAEFPKEMDALFADGKKWFQEAGNPDLGTTERNAARVNAWKSLWPVKEALDRHEEEHPEDLDALDRKYGEVRMMVHWIRKESPIGLLATSGVGPKKGDEEDGAAPAPSTAPTAPGPPGRSTPPPPSAGIPVGPASPASAKPGEPERPSVPALFAAAEAYERKHPRDAPGIQARYLTVVAYFSNPSDPLVRKALEKAGEMESRLKDAYRLLRNEDPDALKGVDDTRLKGMAITVARDIASADAALRERAATTLGVLAHAEAVYSLHKGLEKETEAGPADAMVEALVRIGGTKAADALADFKADERHAERALDALIRLSKRNAVDRRIAAMQMARYMGARQEEHFDRMFATLKGMDRDGVVALAECCKQNTTPSRLIKVLDALSNTREPAAVRVMARYFQHGRGAEDDRIREAAMNAVRKMAKKENLGEAVIPHLFVGVRNKFTRAYTTQLLQELTGQDFNVKQWARWSAWWKSSHPDWKEDESE